jgi:SPP1 family predicted phage head-tail adaptor
MRAGDLLHYVAVQQRSTSQDALGGQVNTWSDVKSIWVGFNPLYGRELLAAKSIATEVTHMIHARYDATLWADPRTAAGYRILHGSRVFNLHAVLNDDERNASVTIYASEGVSDG